MAKLIDRMQTDLGRFLVEWLPIVEDHQWEKKINGLREMVWWKGRSGAKYFNWRCPVCSLVHELAPMIEYTLAAHIALTILLDRDLTIQETNDIYLLMAKADMSPAFFESLRE